MTVQTQETIYIEILDACLRLARHTLNKCERTKALTGVSYWVVALLAERRRKLQTARELRKQENIKLRQRLIPWVQDQTVSYPRAAIVSL